MIKNKYDLAIHNLRMANTIYESNEQLYEENKRDLDVLNDAVQEHELLKSGVKSLLFTFGPLTRMFKEDKYWTFSKDENGVHVWNDGYSVIQCRVEDYNNIKAMLEVFGNVR